MKGKKATTATPSAEATLTSLPEGVVEIIVSHLWGDDKAHLALCCKALLPILGMGHVRVNLDAPKTGRPLLNATRCLRKQPSGVSHLEVFSRDYSDSQRKTRPATRQLVNLSLLTNLRKLTLNRVVISLPALQPVSTRLRELHLQNSCLQGSTDGFLTKGWTALTSLSLTHSRVEAASLTGPLNLPALEDMKTIWFRHQGGALQLDQLTGSCPQLKRLSLELGVDSAQGGGGRGPCCSFRKLRRLEDLFMSVKEKLYDASLDLDLPASLTQFEVAGVGEGDDWSVDLFWALSEAAKCIRRGAQLRIVECRHVEARMQPAQWGASLVKQYRRLGGQLSGLQGLEVWGCTEQLLSALVAVISSAPHLTCVTITITEWLPRMELPPMCSASLESITVRVDVDSDEAPSDAALPPQVAPLVLTFLPGCARLQWVLVQLSDVDLTEGIAAMIRCHSASPTRIMPLFWNDNNIASRTPTNVGVQLMPGPPSPQGVQSHHTVLHECHAARPQQPLKWSHYVVPGFL